MDRVNSSIIFNTSAGGDDNLLSPDGDTVTSLEAYTVVLSATVHIVSTIFGGGSSLAIIIAIITRGNINRYSYILIITFLLACCSLNFVCTPLEITDLLMFHYTHKHPYHHSAAVRTVLYLFITTIISIIIILLSLQSLSRMRNCIRRCVRKMLTTSIMAMLFPAVYFTIRHFQSKDTATSVHYLITEERESFLIDVSILVQVSAVTCSLLSLLVLLTAQTVYWENGRPCLKRKKLEIPEFLISQSNACAQNEGGYGSGKSDTSSPTTPRLVIDGDTSSVKGDDSSHITGMSGNMVKPTGNRLGINMAQVLGRRRHTICQITDTSSTIITPADHIARAKQYNYVRKFSVDISALQAQLQNPKIFRDAPYQSDIDLSRKQPSEMTAAPQIMRPLSPLKPLPGKLDENEEKLENRSTEAESGRSLGIKINPPPVIWVSNDDALSTNGNEALSRDENETTPMGNYIQKDTRGSYESFHEDSEDELDTPIQKPTMLQFDETPDEYTSAPTFDSATSSTESDDLKLMRLVILLSLTFILSMLPITITGLMVDCLTRHAFVNVYTCTLAVSAIQTIVYPHLIASCDEVVHKAIGKLKRRIRFLSCGSHRDVESHTEDSSSVGQI